MDVIAVYVILFAIIEFSSSASYSNCRSVKGDVPLYHRRIKQDPTKHLSLQFVSYPEMLIDRPNPRDIKVISCIFCKDLLGNETAPNGSECKVVAGGVGHTFVKLRIASKPGKGYDYEVKCYGQSNH